MMSKPRNIIVNTIYYYITPFPGYIYKNSFVKKAISVMVLIAVNTIKVVSSAFNNFH